VIHRKKVAGSTFSGIEQSAADFAQYPAKPNMNFDQATSSILDNQVHAHNNGSHCNDSNLMDQILDNFDHQIHCNHSRLINQVLAELDH
jgi:hypothetical protein